MVVSRPQIQQGIISHFFDPLCFPEWEPSTNLVTYGLYRPSSQEHITPIERIPVSPAKVHLSADETQAPAGLSEPVGAVGRCSLIPLAAGRLGVQWAGVSCNSSAPRV